MPKPVNLIIMVEPVAKARARVAVIKGHVREYTPAKTRNAEAEIRITIRQNILHALQWDTEAGPYFPAQMPLRLEALFVIPRPPSTPKKRLFPVPRPDAENYLKLLQDALNKFLYVDDSQITTVLIKKRYGMMPAIHLSVREDVLEGFSSGVPETPPKPLESGQRLKLGGSSGSAGGKNRMF
ncbi:MAG: RusA family crossover junction endodeoxyribonuclease [Candidatus Marinimicrobia bacterium]|nr:RusA family crossover junction endodeoxyribonuclease [Candidatus Neomarinimicrobiota bacterium]MDD5539138.1 RusA family crossover junction endodeoxyribonuclease [Candidatus Neomarinimicrobiota bacterium]